MIKKFQAVFRKVIILNLKFLDIRRKFRDRKTISYFPKKIEDENDMEQRSNIMSYRAAEFKLGQIREENLGKDSEEEVEHLDFMDFLCASLTEEEFEYINYHKSPFYEYMVKYI